MYHVANTAAVTEYLLTLYYNPSLKSYPYTSTIGSQLLLPQLKHSLKHVKGIIFVIFGQLLRSTAMIHASTSFSHSIQFQKRANHKLVTDGVYA